MTKSIFSQGYEKLRQLLIEARQQSQLTQEDVASALQRPQSFVSKYERGERRLDVIEFLQVASVMKANPISMLMDIRKCCFPEFETKDILEIWEITPSDLTYLLEQNPSLRGMLFGYVAEFKLEELWLRHPDITDVVKDDDHNRKKKGDRRIIYKGHSFIIEAKSIQTHSIRYSKGKWYGKAQVDASDRRQIKLPNGDVVNTTLLKVGEFDVLAVNVFPFNKKWDFVFARNQDLPRTEYRGYTSAQRQYLLSSLVPVTWPPEPPFTDNLYDVLDSIIQQKNL